MKKLTVRLLAVLILAVFAGPAAAQDTPAGAAGAGATVSPAIKGDKQAAQPYWERGWKAYKEGKYAEAVTLLEKAYKLYKHWRFQHAIGQAQRRARNWQKSLTAYQLYVKVCPAPDNAVHFNMGECLLRLGKRPEANKAFGTYLKLAPSGPYAAHARHAIKTGKLPGDLGKRDPAKVAQARQLFERAKKIAMQGKWSEAAKIYMDGWNTYKMPELLWNAGQCHYNAKNWYEAAKAIEQRIALPFPVEDAYSLLAGCYEQQGMVTKTRSTWQRYLKLYPKGRFAAEATTFINTPQTVLEKKAKAGAFFENGQKHYEAKRYREAREEFLKAEQALPHPNTAFNIGRCHMHLKEWKSALQRFQNVLATDLKNHPYAHLHAAKCFLQMNMPNNATRHIGLFKKQVKGTPIEKEARTMVRQLEAECKKVRDTEAPNPLDKISSRLIIPCQERLAAIVDTHGPPQYSGREVSL